VVTVSAGTLPGRRGQAARNDVAILAAAREVFLTDPKAPIAAVAERAGVGISALYRRYPGKEALQRRLCHDGLRAFISEAEAAAAQPDGSRAFTTFLDRIVEADVHSLTVHLAGTFTPTDPMYRDTERANALATGLMERARADGALRPDVVAGDITIVLEACAAIRIPADAARTTQLRRRCLAALLDGMSSMHAGPLPGPPPDAEDLNWRWQR